MKVFIIFTLVIVCFYLCGFIRKTDNISWMSKTYTMALKGFSILTVVWAHEGARVGVNGIQFIAGVGVALFLIVSGYGLEKSYVCNGLTRFWIKRIVKVIIPLLLCELIWELLNKNFNIKLFAANGIFLGAGGWFVRYMIECYVLFYLSKVVCRKINIIKQIDIYVLFGAFALFFVYEGLWGYIEDIPFLRARQMFSFPVGVLIASRETKINDFLNKKKYANLCCVGAFIIGLGCMLITQLDAIKALPEMLSNFIAIFTVLPLAAGVLLITRRWKIIVNNVFLYGVGIISYEMFLVQNYSQLFVENKIIYLIMYLIFTIFIAFVIHMVLSVNKWRNIIDGRFNSNNINQE